MLLLTFKKVIALAFDKASLALPEDVLASHEVEVLASPQALTLKVSSLLEKLDSPETVLALHEAFLMLPNGALAL